MEVGGSDSRPGTQLKLKSSSAATCRAFLCEPCMRATALGEAVLREAPRRNPPAGFFLREPADRSSLK